MPYNNFDTAKTININNRGPKAIASYLFKSQKNTIVPCYYGKPATFEIAMLGTLDIDPNKKDYIIGSIPEKRFSGTQVLSILLHLMEISNTRTPRGIGFGLWKGI